MPNGVCEQRELKTDDKEKIDAVLVLDASGSMRVTDPLKLRNEGAELFTQFMKSGDKLGVVEFSDTWKILRPLTDYSSDQESAVKGIISSTGDSGEFTDLLAGIKGASDILASSKRSDASQIIVLLSDGKMDPKDGNSGALTEDLLENVLPNLKRDGIKIYTLAFSDEADKDLLAQIAAATGGVNWFTPNADKIHQSFADLFLVVKKPQVVPLGKRGFRIDSDVQEATFYIDREQAPEITLTSPGGVTLSESSPGPEGRWFKGQKFDVITVGHPEPGDWQISGLPSTESFATVLTNLKLVTDWPGSFYVDEPVLLQARLYESDKPVMLPQMTGSAQYAFQISPTDKVSEPIVRELLVDDGTNGDKIANDGIFSRELTLSEVGEYRLRVLAKAPTFERNQQIPFRVRPQLVTLTVEGEKQTEEEAPPPEAEGAEKKRKGAYFLIKLAPEASDLKKVQLKLIAVDEERTRYTLPTSTVQGAPLEYQTPVDILPKEGRYEIQAMLTAEGRGAKAVRSSSKALIYDKKAHGEESISHEFELKIEVPEEKKDSPLVPILLVTVINLACGGVTILMMKKAVANTAAFAPEVSFGDSYLGRIESLRARASETAINFENPIFKAFMDSPSSEGSSAAASQQPEESSESASSSTEASQDPAPPTGESETSEGDGANEQPPGDAPKEGEE